jgi:hypothetical protein
MGLEGNKTELQYLLVQHKIIEDKIQEDIQENVGAPTGCVAKCVQGHELPEKRVKEVNGTYDHISQHITGVDFLLNKISCTGQDILNILKMYNRRSTI